MSDLDKKAGAAVVLERAAAALEDEADYRRQKAASVFFNNPSGQSLNGQALDDEARADFLIAVAGELRTQVEREAV